MRWYRRAADLGNPHGMFHVGAMYWTGDGCKRDDKEAARWWQKAAELGQTSAMVDLAFTYKEGRGNPVNYAEALRWYNQAIGHRDAKYQYECQLCHIIRKEHAN